MLWSPEPCSSREPVCLLTSSLPKPRAQFCSRTPLAAASIPASSRRTGLDGQRWKDAAHRGCGERKPPRLGLVPLPGAAFALRLWELHLHGCLCRNPEGRGDPFSKGDEPVCQGCTSSWRWVSPTSIGTSSVWPDPGDVPVGSLTQPPGARHRARRGQSHPKHPPWPPQPLGQHLSRLSTAHGSAGVPQNNELGEQRWEEDRVSCKHLLTSGTSTEQTTHGTRGENNSDVKTLNLHRCRVAPSPQRALWGGGGSSPLRSRTWRAMGCQRVGNLGDGKHPLCPSAPRTGFWLRPLAVGKRGLPPPWSPEQGRAQGPPSFVSQCHCCPHGAEGRLGGVTGGYAGQSWERLRPSEAEPNGQRYTNKHVLPLLSSSP